jgi:hypothetical protein
VWIKREHDRRAGQAARVKQQSFDDPRMTSMNTIEISNRDGTSAKVGSQLVPVPNQLELHVENPSFRKA